MVMSRVPENPVKSSVRLNASTPGRISVASPPKNPLAWATTMSTTPITGTADVRIHTKVICRDNGAILPSDPSSGFRARAATGRTMRSATM